MNEHQAYSMEYLTYSDVLFKHSDDFQIGVLPWGSLEPHGLHLPYATDGFLADIVSRISIEKTYELKYKFFLLPPIFMGSQNIGQTDKKLCIHFNNNTQFNVLKDIVHSLDSQGVKRLVIINGHNGNNFKSIIRDIENIYKDFRIYVCNYLDIVEHDKAKEPLSLIKFPEVDDHAGFTETCLVMTFLKDFVNPEDLKLQAGPYEKETDRINEMWTPRNWDSVSQFTCVGNPSEATPEYGAIIVKHVTDVISDSLIEIYKKWVED